MFKKVRIVALDLNGTLIDGRYRRWEEIFEEEMGFKKRVNALPRKWYEAQTGRLTFEQAVSLTYIVDHPESLQSEAFNVYMANLQLREGCVELLNDLRQRYELVICSDTSGVTKKIAETFDLEKYFTKFFYSLDVGWMKCDLEYWNKVLSYFPRRRPDEFVMVGDNPSRDIYWPNMLGMGTIQIKTTELLPSSNALLDDSYKPDFYVRSLDEIHNILLK